MVANCTPSVPITHIAVDTPQWPRRTAAWEEQDIREQCAFYKPHRLKFYLWLWLRDKCKQGSTVYGYPTAPAESSPLPQSGEPIMPLHLEPVKLSLWQGRDSGLANTDYCHLNKVIFSHAGSERTCMSAVRCSLCSDWAQFYMGDVRQTKVFGNRGSVDIATIHTKKARELNGWSDALS